MLSFDAAATAADRAAEVARAQPLALNLKLDHEPCNCSTIVPRAALALAINDNASNEFLFNRYLYLTSNSDDYCNNNKNAARSRIARDCVHVHVQALAIACLSAKMTPPHERCNCLDRIISHASCVIPRGGWRGLS
jgi:hypothetical protein